MKTIILVTVMLTIAKLVNAQQIMDNKAIKMQGWAKHWATGVETDDYI